MSLFLLHTIYQEQYIKKSYTCGKWWSLHMLFSFFLKFSFFGLLVGWKGKKTPKMTKKICLLQLISQESYIIWLSFMVHLCKTISLEFFFIFSKFWFFGLLRRVRGWRGKRAKNSISQESYIIWFLFMVLMCKIIISPGDVFIFSKFWFFGLLGE